MSKYVNKDKRAVTDQDRAEIRRLAGEGLGRNEIARRLGRSPATISDVAAAMNPPVTFDRTMTAIATEVRKVDAKARRARIRERLYERAEYLLARMDQAEEDGFPFTATSIHGIETVALRHVPGTEEKALASAINNYLTQAQKLEQADGDPNVDAARSMLAGLADGLNKLAAHDAEEDDGEEG